jgi:hypothetical protein
MKRINFVSLFAAAAFGGLVFQATDTPASASGLNDVLNSSGASLNGHVKIEPAGAMAAASATAAVATATIAGDIGMLLHGGCLAQQRVLRSTPRRGILEVDTCAGA